MSEQGEIAWDRFEPEALKVLYFTRAALVEHGGARIEPHHLVIALLRAAPDALMRFVNADLASAEELRREVLALFPPGQTLFPPDRELPLGAGLEVVLVRARQAADELRNHQIAPEHLVLALVTEGTGELHELLDKAGVRAQKVREYLRTRK